MTAAYVDDFHQTTPTDGAAPSEVTIVRVTYDDEYLYIAAELRDSDPSGIRATQMIQGRTFYSDDRFWIMLDSFNSKRNDYFFQVNANGIRRDALRENNSRFIEEWSAIWQVESAIHEDGWSTEIAIPFKSISFAPDSDTWGINFGRSIVRKQEYAYWSSHDRQDWPAYSGEVTGIGEIEQGLGLDIVPSLSLGQSRDLVFGEDNNTFEPSLDIRYRITPSLAATFTINTDFSTAEIDDQQVALDRFSLFFPEKRDFFLQDAGIFEFGDIDTNGRPFFSRKIGLSDDGSNVLSLGQSRDLVFGEDNNTFEPSLDIRYRITPSLAATFTINTDFSTAEIDDQQVALDRFSLFFPEKRDFFLQDAGIFEFGDIDTNGRPFFSRKIGLSDDGKPIGIVAGAKLTGRVSNFNLGALAIRQEEFGDLTAQDLFVARASMNVLDESAVGLIMTHGDPTSNDTNSLVGAVW